MKWSAFTCVFLLAAVDAIAQGPQVVINELLFMPDAANSDPNRTYDWVELYNAGTAGADLTGWKLSARDGGHGLSARNLPNVTLPAGKYLVVRFTSGANSLDFSSGSATYFTGDNPATPYWNSTSDEAALYSTSGIVDFLAWSHTGHVFQPGAAHNDAVAAGIWMAGVALVSDAIGDTDEKVRQVTPGTSIGRDSLSTDTNMPFDFDALGGRDAIDLTIGRQNLDMRNVVSQTDVNALTTPLTARAPAPAAPVKKAWTVMLYFCAANNLEKWLWENALQIQQYGGSNNNVNFVLLFGGKQEQLGRLDSKGNLAGFADAGGNFRGLIPPADPRVSPYLILQTPDATAPDQPAEDMGDPTTLSDFIAWTMTNYPANHYALILNAHGSSWKSFGPDERYKGSANRDSTADSLYMGEFSRALAGQHFDLIVFDSCMMASVEVAYQFRPFTSWFVASEERMPVGGLGYPNLAIHLQTHPEWDGKQLGTQILNDYLALNQGSTRITLSLIDESKAGDLFYYPDVFAKALTTGVGLIQARDDPADNVQTLIANAALSTVRMRDDNYMDLYTFAENIANDPAIPSCVKNPAIQLQSALGPGGAIAAQVH